MASYLQNASSEEKDKRRTFMLNLWKMIFIVSLAVLCIIFGFIDALCKHDIAGAAIAGIGVFTGIVAISLTGLPKKNVEK